MPRRPRTGLPRPGRGARSRAERRVDRALPASEPEPRGYARGRAKDDAARAALEPLAPGERPGGGHGRRDRGAGCSLPPT